MLLEGLHIPLTTPFHPDGRLNSHKLASNISRYSKTPAAGLIALGPSAEPTLLYSPTTRLARSCAPPPRPPRQKRSSSPASPATASTPRLPSPTSPQN